jgi:hypothetical protein
MARLSEVIPIGVLPMTERTEQRNPQQKQPAPKPGADMTERDLDQVSGGASQPPPKTSTPPPSGPIPVPYPNKA